MPPHPKLVNRPLTAIELLRIGTALVPYGLPFADNVFVVMAADAPNEVDGVVQTEAEAIQRAELRGTRFFAYGPYDPPSKGDYPRQLDRVEPTYHDITNVDHAEPETPAPTGAASELKHVTAMSLHVTFASGETVSYRCAPHTDAIFVTQAAREAFMYPRYYSIFGTKHVRKIREKIGEVLTGGAGLLPPRMK